MNCNGTTHLAVTASMLSLALAACGDATSGSNRGAVQQMPGAGTVEFIDGDVRLGREDAPVTLIEYASLTCPACREFHTKTLPRLKREFIDSGKLVLVLREFPTAPHVLSRAQASLARCSGREHVHDMVSAFYDRQHEIIEAAGKVGALGLLVEIAAEHGLDESEVDACLASPAVEAAVEAAIHSGEQQGVRSTPTLFLNGKRVPFEQMKPERLAELIRAALPDGGRG